MVLCEMIRIETEAITRLRQRQAIRVLSGDIAAVLVQVIEDADGEVRRRGVSHSIISNSGAEIWIFWPSAPSGRWD
ncbi:hypothetical protein SAMCFNEI73_pB0063 (plasmid) [Sinorhizobium americanum]|uniref:Uncharacterized protein n=1 Tax=Sinorhizobium americanum TaxID=194963 RepID=A0A1L3LT75_9HYPH|nr:hypothetical protein SAMCCGM7_pB0058 [Sinorhizobium americanum CCGM7]APG93263.1 hypothetical protein SAMCFNEI73_pB0063 [Sinorhizobium americanum]